MFPLSLTIKNHKMKNLLYAFYSLSSIVFIAPSVASAQCISPQVEVQLTILPDEYPGEISWSINNGTSVIASGGAAGDTFCVNPGTCLNFTISDAAGDGICCSSGQGSYTLKLNGVLISSGGNYGAGTSALFNCPPGQDCNSAQIIQPGQFTAETANQWYKFTPDSSGMYFISTCGNNTCDTKLWVYDHCAGILISEGNEGTIYYDDNAGGCGQQARVNALMQAGSTYYIRVGDVGTSCTGEINWSLTYNGPIVGCMDPTSCNYNPLATVESGICYEDGDPNCPDGRPDLVVLEDVIRTSVYLTTINASNCHVVEGCLTGYGTRDIIRFTTHIKNIGTADYYIGSPQSHPTQFSYGNCHGHWHYEGYAEYVMYDTQGFAIPVGFKNGFCVLDLECGDGGNAQYGCGNMGISRQCGDIYGAGLDCQWVDITDLDTGTYTMVVKVNWDNSPDALGKIELSLTNNWAQVCVKLSENALGQKSIALAEECNPYVDCNGEVYGSSRLDCEGACGGTRIMGDINTTGTQEMADANKYVNDILGADISPTPCNDINQDNRITVFDAALISSCVNFGQNHPHNGNVPHNHCNFPGGLLNPSDTVSLNILNVDFSEKFVDIGILNPNTSVTSYEFDMKGIKIWNVENLINPAEYPIQPSFLLGGKKVIGISYQDSIIRKFTEPTPLCRIHYYEMTDSIICIDKIVDIVSNLVERTVTEIQGECWELDVTGFNNFDKANYFQLVPNPASTEVNIDLHLSKAMYARIGVVNTVGQVIFSQTIEQAEKQRITLNTSDFANGIYLINLMTEKGMITKKLVVSH